MKKDKIKLKQLVENPENYFRMLKPASKTRRKIYNVDIDVTGYNELFYTIIDLLKVAMLALDGIEMDNSGHIHTEKYVYTLLKIIEKMIPLEEADLLDILHEKYLKELKERDKN